MASKAIVTKLRAKFEKASKAIYAFAPNDFTKFNDCFKLATDEAREAYHAAQSALIEAEYAAIAKGKAYRGAFSMLVWNR